MKQTILALFLGLILLNGCAKRTIYLKIAPPRRKTEIRSERPDINYIWVEGHWQWNRRKEKFIWLPGHWIKKKDGRIWISGSWERTRRGWVWSESYWK